MPFGSVLRRTVVIIAAIGSALLDMSCTTPPASDVTSHAAKSTPSPFAERSTRLDKPGPAKPTPRFVQTPHLEAGTGPDAAPLIGLRADAEPTSGGAPLQVAFEATVNETVPGVHYQWNFGDGSSATGSSATHTYQSPGEYVATVHASGAGFDEMDDVSITVEEEGFDVDVEADPDIGRAPLQVRLAASLDDDFAGSCTFQWDFGDGERAFGNPTTHTYRHAGEYTALVTATNAQGQIARHDITITVDDDQAN